MISIMTSTMIKLINHILTKKSIEDENMKKVKYTIDCYLYNSYKNTYTTYDKYIIVHYANHDAQLAIQHSPNKVMNVKDNIFIDEHNWNTYGDLFKIIDKYIHQCRLNKQ